MSHVQCSPYVAALLIASLLHPATMTGQNPKPKRAVVNQGSQQPPATVTAANKQTVQAEKAVTSGKTSAEVIGQVGVPLPSPGGDYITCKFTYQELQTLIAPEQVITLSRADADNLVTRVSEALRKQLLANTVTLEYYNDVLKRLTINALAGMPPSKAVAAIVQALAHASAEQKTQNTKQQAKNDAEAAKSAQSQAQQQQVLSATQQKVSNTDAQRRTAQLQFAQATSDLTAAQKTLADAAVLLAQKRTQLKAAQDAQAKGPTIKPQTPPATPAAQPNPVATGAPADPAAPAPVAAQAAGADQQTVLDTAVFTAQAAVSAAQTAVQTQTEAVASATEKRNLAQRAASAFQTLFEIAVQDQKAASDAAAQADLQKTKEDTAAASSAVVAAARDSINRLIKPDDIGCAISVMTFEEMKHDYGRLIATNYIGIQVVVRNLNHDQPFTLHDVEIAVNTDPGGDLPRFFSGRDKQLVRSLTAAQSGVDPRFLFVEGATMIGTIMTSAAGVFAGALVDAASVYNGGFVTSLDKLWKNTSTDQLNLLNDTGFSSSARSQMVVPKSDSVMFVTFVPAKQFADGWWAQDCAKRTLLGVKDFYMPPPTADNLSAIADRLEQGQQLQEAIQADSRPDAVAAEVKLLEALKSDPAIQNTLGVAALNLLQGDRHGNAEVSRALAACRVAATPCADTTHAGGSSSGGSCNNGSFTFVDAQSHPYKSWSPTSKRLFEDLTTVIVAGIHTVEQNQLRLTLTHLDCGSDDTGKVVFKKDDKTLSCTLTGTNLDKVSLLRLRNSADAGDPTIAEGSASVSGGDNTTGTAIFSVDRLHALNGADYAVAAVDKQGIESVTSQVLHFDNGPYASSVTTEISLKTPPTQIILQGARLSKVDRLSLGASGVLFSPDSSSVQTDSQRVFKVPTDLSSLGSASTSISVALVFAGKSDPVATDLTIALKQ